MFPVLTAFGLVEVNVAIVQQPASQKVWRDDAQVLMLGFHTLFEVRLRSYRDRHSVQRKILGFESR